MDIEKANKAIKNAYIGGIGWGILILIFTLSNFAPLDLLGAFVIFGLAFGIYKRSRICAVLMLILWILLVVDRGEVLVKVPIESKNLFSILTLAIVGIPFVGVLAYFFFQGIRGTIVYHKLIKVGTGKKIPITPSDIIRRMKDVPEILEWSKRKRLSVFGPEFFGGHQIYIDKNLKHVVILLKSDFTTHVFVGNPTCAEEWRKYDEKQNILLSQIYPSDAFEWKIYKDIVLYKGKSLPPKDIPEEPYFGKILKVEDFNDDINDEWIVAQIKELYNK